MTKDQPDGLINEVSGGVTGVEGVVVVTVVTFVVVPLVVTVVGAVTLVPAVDVTAPRAAAVTIPEVFVPDAVAAVTADEAIALVIVETAEASPPLATVVFTAPCTAASVIAAAAVAFAAAEIPDVGEDTAVTAWVAKFEAWVGLALEATLTTAAKTEAAVDPFPPTAELSPEATAAETVVTA